MAYHHHVLGFTNSVPKVTIADIQTDTDPPDPDDNDATLLAHTTQCTWTKTNDCDVSGEVTTEYLSDLSVFNLFTKLWYRYTGKGHCIRIQDVNGIQWRMLALQVETARANAPSNVCIVFRACNGALSSLEEDGEHIYECINNKLDERNSNIQWHNATVLELAILAKCWGYLQIWRAPSATPLLPGRHG